MTIRKYQAFISSTFRDLHEARERVTWEVLKIGFVPVGMENFSAMDERGWATIAKAIDQSDYYVVIVAGLYGSTDESGKSWTEREYDYAHERGIPVLAFIRDAHSVPGDMVERGDAVAKVDGFARKLRNAHHVESWKSVDDLRAKVPVALMKIAREDESEGRERPGWYRGASPVAALDELTKLSAENRELRSKVDSLRSSSPSPRLELRIRQECGQSGIQQVVKTAAGNQMAHRVPSRWYHLRVWNSNRSAVAVHGVRVLLMEIWEEYEGQWQKTWDEEVPMVWTHFKGDERTIGAPADADLCWVMSGQDSVRLETRAVPFSLPRDIPANKSVRVVFMARGHEADSDRFCVEISWDGTFHNEDERMVEHFLVRPAADPVAKA